MSRSEASTRLLLAALGLSPDELDDALTWARGRASELLDSLDDTELQAMLEREVVASPRRSSPPTSAPQAPKPVISSWNLPQAPWQPSRSTKPVAPTSAPQDEEAVLADEAPAEEEDGTRDEETVLASESATEEADDTRGEERPVADDAAAAEEDGPRDEELVLADESAAEVDGPWDGDTLLSDESADGDALSSDESATDADGPWDGDTLLSDDDVMLADDDVMLVDESAEPEAGPWDGGPILADGPPLPPQAPPMARTRASPRIVPAAAARSEERDPDAPAARTDHSRRRATRYSLSTPVVVRVDQVPGLLELNTRDISRHGIFIESNSPPEPNTSIAVQLPFPDGSGVVNLVGEVVRVVTTRQAAASGRAPGFGVTFSPVSEESRRELERLLEHAKSSAAADVPRPRPKGASVSWVESAQGAKATRVESAQGAKATRVESVQGAKATRVESVQPPRGAAAKISKG